MNKQNETYDNEVNRPDEAVTDLDPSHREIEQVKGGSFSWGRSLSSGGDRPSEN
jgi:hypothetical protein